MHPKFQKKKQASETGLTLIEVLIALVIIAISFSAVLKAEQDSIRTVSYLQDKTLATWVANNVIYEMRLNMLDTSSDDRLQDQTQMLGRTWYWDAVISSTQSDDLNSVVVEVKSSKEGHPVVTVTALIPATESP